MPHGQVGSACTYTHRSKALMSSFPTHGFWTLIGAPNPKSPNRETLNPKTPNDPKALEP